MTEEQEELLTPRERAFLAQYSSAKTPAELDQGGTNLRGVGGWLGLLVASLLVFYPLFAILKTWLGNADAMAMNPELAQLAAWQTLVTVSWVIVGLSVAISILAGWRLNYHQVPSSVMVAVICLWLIGPVRVLVEIVLSSSLAGSAIGQSGDIANIAQSLVVAAIWTAYLLVSSRVKNTYRK